MHDDLRPLAAAAAGIETLQFQLDAAQVALAEAAEAVLEAGDASLGDVAEACGLSQSELLDLLTGPDAESAA